MYYYDKIYFSTSLDNLVKIAKEHGYFKHYNIDFKDKNLDIFKLPDKKILIQNDSVEEYASASYCRHIAHYFL